MKKYYKYGEIILSLRKEYKECKYLLDELNNCINIKADNSTFTLLDYFQMIIV